MKDISQETTISEEPVKECGTDDELDEEALRVAALKSLRKPKTVNPHNLIVVNTECEVAEPEIKLEPISPSREEGFIIEKQKALEAAKSEEECSEESETDESNILDMDEADEFVRLLETMEAEMEGKEIPTKQKKQKKKKIKEKKVKEQEEEVEFLDIKTGKTKPPAPVINIPESPTPERRYKSPLRSRSRSRSPPPRRRSYRSRSPSRGRSRSRSRYRNSPRKWRSRTPSPRYRRRYTPSRSRSRSRSRSPPYRSYRPSCSRSRSITPIRRRGRTPIRARTRSPLNRRSPRRWSRSPLPRKRSPLAPRRSLTPPREKQMRRSLSPRDKRPAQPPSRRFRRTPPRRRSAERPKRRSADRLIRRSAERKKVIDEKKPTESEKNDESKEVPLDPVLEARRKKFESVPDPKTTRTINLKAVKETIEPVEEEEPLATEGVDALWDDSDESDDQEGRFKDANRQKPRAAVSFRNIREGHSIPVPSRLDEVSVEVRDRNKNRPQRTQQAKIRMDRGRSRQEDRRWNDRRRNRRESPVRRKSVEKERPLSQPVKVDKESETLAEEDDFDSIYNALSKQLELDTAEPSTTPPQNTQSALQPRIFVKKDLFDPKPENAPGIEVTKKKVKIERDEPVSKTDEEPPDLRSILARKRKERLNRVEPLNSRLVQSALQSLVGTLPTRTTSTSGRRHVKVMSGITTSTKAVSRDWDSDRDDNDMDVKRSVRKVIKVPVAKDTADSTDEETTTGKKPPKFRLKRSVTITSQCERSRTRSTRYEDERKERNRNRY